MPTYDYLCEACGHEFEQFQSITAKLMRRCPECGKLKLKRLIGTGAGIIFKGSGFYETDYRSDSYKKQAKKEADAAKPKTESTKSDKGKGETTAKPNGSKPTNKKAGDSSAKKD